MKSTATKKQLSRIEINPAICNGKPVVAGTRVAVETVLEFLSAGDSVDDILAGYPNLSREDILACLDYARRLGAVRSVSIAAA